MREITAVFQDCVLCGSRGRKKIAEYANKGIMIRKAGFTTEEGKDLIHKAVFEHGIGSMPFYVEGERFSTDLDKLIKCSSEVKDVPKNTKSTKKSQKKVTPTVIEDEEKVDGLSANS